MAIHRACIGPDSVPAPRSISARRQVATLLHCEPTEVVFTSGGTEANNSALAGVFFKSQRKDAAAFHY